MEAIDRAPSRFVAIEIVPSRIQYQWVSEFVDTVEYEPIKVRLEAAINGKGAFRRFKDILLTLPDERRRWFEFRDRRMRARVREWIEENGIEPTNEPDWGEDAVDEVNTEGAVDSIRAEELEAQIKERGDSNASVGTSDNGLRPHLVHRAHEELHNQPPLLAAP